MIHTHTHTHTHTGTKDALEKGMGTHSSIHAWRIAWAEEPGGLQSTGSQRVAVTERLILSLSYIHIFVFRFFSIIGYYKILNIAPCDIQ